MSDHSEASLLSCESTDYEIDAFSDDESDYEDNKEENIDLSEIFGSAPYLFEPYDSNVSDSSDEEVIIHGEVAENQERINSLDWCKCGACSIMPSVRENICCREIANINDVRQNTKDIQSCITLHPGFTPVCLNTHVLEVEYFQYRQQYGDRIERGNERTRYTAYRQFVIWCWTFLGKKVRVILPVCAVSAIRNAFPAPNQYIGFHEPDSD